MLAIRLVITILCAVGFYASVFMLRKSLLDARGLLGEPSVVQSRRANLLAGLPNALFGCIYYAAVTAAAWLNLRPLLLAALAAAIAAAAASAYLGYSLLFVTRRSCAYCWTAHAVNWLLLAALVCLVCRWV
ncbi:MAG: vitamin K epoxide reductase family protein [Candidatus Baltobacteraceae bacterium]